MPFTAREREELMDHVKKVRRRARWLGLLSALLVLGVYISLTWQNFEKHQEIERLEGELKECE